MKYNKNADTLLFLLLFTMDQHKKSIEKTLLVSTDAQKSWKTAVSGCTLPQYLPNSKSKFSSKFIFRSNIFVILSTDKNPETISVKVSMITDFKSLQQETTKGTLRP